MNSLNITRCKFLDWSPLPVEALSFSPDGLWLALCHTQAEIHILNSHTWHIQATIPGDSSSSIRTMHWVPSWEGENERVFSLFKYRLLTTGLDGRISLWNLHTLGRISQGDSYGGAIFDSKLSPNKDRLAIVCDDGGIRIYNLTPDDISLHKSLTKSQGRLLSVCWMDQDTIFAGNSKSIISRYNVPSGHANLKLKVDEFTHRGKTGSKGVHIWALLYVKATHNIISGDSTGAVTFWDAKSCTQICTFRENQADILTICSSPDESIVLASGVDSKITALTYTQNTNSWVLMGAKYTHTSDIRSMSISCNDMVVTGGLDTKICVFEHLKSITEMSTRPIRLHLIPPLCTQWITLCESLGLVLYQRANSLELWSIRSNEATPINNEPFKVAAIQLSDTHQIVCSDLSPDGQVISVSNQKGTRLIGLDLDELEIGEIECPDLRRLPAYSLRFINKNVLVICTGDNSDHNPSSKHFKLIVYDIWNSTTIAQFDDLPNPIIRMELSSGSQWLGTIDSLGRVDIYNLDYMQHLSRLPRFDSDEICTTLAFHPDHVEVALFGSENSFYIYDLENRAIKQPNLSEATIQKIPKHFLNRSDGSISGSLWLTTKLLRPTEIVNPSSYIVCQTATALCIINLNETYTDNPIAISEDQFSTISTKKRLDLLNDETLQLFPRKRFIPGSLMHPKKSRKINSPFMNGRSEDNKQSNSQHETDVNDSSSELTMNSSSRQDSPCNENYITLSTFRSTIMENNNSSRRKFSTHRQYKFIMGLKYIAGNIEEPSANQENDKQINGTKRIKAGTSKSSLVLFSIPPKPPIATSIQPFASKRYGV